jgi:hypothetical protein
MILPRPLTWTLLIEASLAVIIVEVLGLLLLPLSPSRTEERFLLLELSEVGLTMSLIMVRDRSGDTVREEA